MSKPTTPTLGRRAVFAGAGAAGALAAAAAVLPRPQEAAPAAKAEAAPASSGGYRLTEHVKQYYAVART